MSKQTEKTNIGPLVVSFLKERKRNKAREFYIEELRNYVWDNKDTNFAPTSPDRILRDLRQKGVVKYKVIDRARSLYKVL